MDYSILIGRHVTIIDKESDYFGHWGYIEDWDGDHFHVTGGSIATDEEKELCPIFDRDQLRVKRK
ncbi:hypothetical protein M5X17_31125 [Paenibacillus alvei]|uniref:hypothetical protein n=1 Tax=Paenibacillus alvei TaxID=44250 RepID=UPI002281EDE7|nr:hypothetical protein [Paenibacillus alvei]MCY9738146.1 hypothetical protein [Paenibacillus alvei]